MGRGGRRRGDAEEEIGGGVGSEPEERRVAVSGGREGERT